MVLHDVFTVSGELTINFGWVLPAKEDTTIKRLEIDQTDLKLGTFLNFPQGPIQTAPAEPKQSQ